MTRSIVYYFTKGIQDTIFAFKQMPLSQRMLLLVFPLISLLGKLFFFTRPFFVTAEINLSKLIAERKRFSIWEMFNHNHQQEQFRKLKVSYIVMDFFTFFAAVVLISLPILIWFYVGPMLTSYELQVGLYNVLVIYFIVFGIMVFLFSISYYRPLAYVTFNNPTFDSGTHLSMTQQTLKTSQRMNNFAIHFLYFVFLTLIGLLVSFQTSTTFFSFLVISLGYQGFLPTLIFSIVFWLIIFLFLLWLIPFLYTSFMMIQHHVIIDSLMVLKPTKNHDIVSSGIETESPPTETPNAEEAINEKTDASPNKIGKAKRKQV